MDAAEAHRVAAMLVASPPMSVDWPKGAAVSSRMLLDLALQPAIIDPVVEILGSDVVLWGASVVTSPPGHVHPYHVDIETSHPDARTVSVWIGLENTTRDSSLSLTARSHRFGVPIQQVARDKQRRRGEYGEGEILAWATERDPGASIVTLDISDGEAIWFDGHLWHGSHNTTGHLRRALLLQYASAATPIRIPDFSSFDWPFRFFDAPRPPCIVVAGESGEDVNRIVPGPFPQRGTDFAMTTWAKHLELPLPQDPSGFRPHPLFRGVTANLSALGCHVSTLVPGVSPHEPHLHDEEEILIMLAGEAEVLFDDAAGRRTRRVTPGVLTYYPAGRAHTIRALGDEPAQYLMFKWTGPSREVAGRLDAAAHVFTNLQPGNDGGFRSAVLFEGATTYLAKLHCHLTVLDPGGGYAQHVDAHDLAIVLLEGTVTTVGITISAPAVIFSSGGIPHGMQSAADSPARYLVLEFHGNVAFPVAADAGASLATDTPSLAPALPSDAAKVRRGRRMRVAVWNAAGRLTGRTPRVKRVLRRWLGWMSPWR